MEKNHFYADFSSHILIFLGLDKNCYVEDEEGKKITLLRFLIILIKSRILFQSN